MAQSTIRVLEDVFVTEGVPEETFVDPPNFNEVFVDIRHPGKPVIIEGPSGTGKTTTVKKVLERLGKAEEWTYLSARKSEDLERIRQLCEKRMPGVYVVDDFHRLPPEFQAALSNHAKVAAEESDKDKNPKLILIGINQVGTALIQFTPDIAKRCGIHRIFPATEKQANDLIARGANALNIRIENSGIVFQESQGDYWLMQTLCSTACKLEGILESQTEVRTVTPNIEALRQRIVGHLQNAYYESVKEFCRGRRFRPSGP